MIFPQWYLTLFYYYYEITKAGYFIKKKRLFWFMVMDVLDLGALPGHGFLADRVLRYRPSYGTRQEE
jgi:hypothetical protein